jgi:hypothetical protein
VNTSLRPVIDFDYKPLDPLNGIPKLEALIPESLSARLTGLLPPWVEVPELTLRKPPKRQREIDLYQRGTQEDG